MFHPDELNFLADNALFSQSAPGKELQAQPLGFIDVGARGGAHDLVNPIAKLTGVLGFEPDEPECKRLMQNPDVYEPWANFVLEPIALADKHGMAELVLLSASTNHSLLSPNTEFTQRYRMVKWEEVGREPLETETLDKILFTNHKDNPTWGEFMKLDTQGTEFEILKGAERTLNERSVALVMEVAFCELYKSQKLFSEIEIFLRDFGFTFYGFMPIHGRSKKLIDKRTHTTRERAMYADAVFFKDPLPGGFRKRDLRPRESYVLFTCALLLGYYDFALELAQETWLKTSDAAETNRIQQLVMQVAKLPEEKTHHQLLNLTKAVEENPSMVNVLVGNFVDKRRQLCDYDDVLNVSPLPKTL